MERAFIFDFNGVLWWDVRIQEHVWDQVAVKLRGKPFSDEEKLHKLHGRPKEDILEYLTGRKMDKRELTVLALEIENIYQKLCLEEGKDFKLSPGAVDLLERLKRSSTPMTIATSSDKGDVDFFANHLHLENWFDISKIVYNDGSFPGKPAPDTYLKSCKVLGVDPKDAVAIEDSESGIRAAQAAGIGKIIALGPKERHDKLLQLDGVTQVVENLGQIGV